jgi:cysteine synthase
VSVDVHQRETATEIHAQLPPFYKRIRVVSGSGTGATLAGVTAGLASYGYAVRQICAVPVDRNQAFSNKIPGVVDRASQFLDWKRIEKIFVPEEMALAATRALIAQGIPAGPSSGLNAVAAALCGLAEPLADEECIVTFLPDKAERYGKSHPELFAA